MMSSPSYRTPDGEETVISIFSFLKFGHLSYLPPQIITFYERTLSDLSHFMNKLWQFLSNFMNETTSPDIIFAVFARFRSLCLLHDRHTDIGGFAAKEIDLGCDVAPDYRTQMHIEILVLDDD